MAEGHSAVWHWVKWHLSEWHSEAKVLLSFCAHMFIVNLLNVASAEGHSAECSCTIFLAYNLSIKFKVLF